MGLYVYLILYVLMVGCLAYSVIKQVQSLIYFSAICLIVVSLLLGVVIGVKKGEANVLSGNSTYKMVIQYEKVDTVLSVTDTIYILK